MSDHVTPAALSARLGFSARTLRRAHARAEEDRRLGARGTEEERERRAALLTAEATPGGFLRWTLPNAARLLRAFRKTPPRAWERAS